MKTTKVIAIDLKRVGGYLTTIAAALSSVYFMSCRHVGLGILAMIFSFYANYYTDFVMNRK